VEIKTAMPGPLAQAEIARQKPHMSPSLIHCYPLMVKRASGCMVEDIDGNVLLDVQAGVATCSTGHCHPAVAAAVKAQVDTLIHICGTDFFYPGYGELCERLGKLAPKNEGGWQTFLTNSGTEAVEAAIKLSRYSTGRSQLIAFRGGFHGRSLGSLSLTASKPKYRKGFGPLTPGTHHVDYGDWESIEKKLFMTTVPAQEVAAIVVEPVQGEGGYIPASDTPISGSLIAEVFHQAGFPAGVVNLVVGGGRTVGQALIEHPDVDGVTFTGSYDIGFNQLYKNFSKKFPKPCIAEMGGKNPAIVSQLADIEKAAQGVFRSAFGMGGQKCSACSRVFVQEAVADRFLGRLKELAENAVVGDPSDKKTFLGPVGVKSGYEDFKRFVELAKKDGKIVTGGEVFDGELAKGYFVKPTIVADLPSDHELMVQELFLPIVCVERVKDLDEGIRKANNTDLGLTAGFFSENEAEVEQFLDRIEAGVVYVNRPAGATTGAWPGVQPFGGWKGSGSSGKNIGGLYTLLCYLREQSRTVTR
jgi:hypothetical protein